MGQWWKQSRQLSPEQGGVSSRVSWVLKDGYRQDGGNEEGQHAHKEYLESGHIQKKKKINRWGLIWKHPLSVFLCVKMNWKLVEGTGYSYTVCVCVLNCGRLFMTVWTVAHQAPHPWDTPGKNTGVDCQLLLQGIFPAQGSNPHLLHCRHSVYHWAREDLTHNLKAWLAWPLWRAMCQYLWRPLDPNSHDPTIQLL